MNRQVELRSGCQWCLIQLIVGRAKVANAYAMVGRVLKLMPGKGKLKQRQRKQTEQRRCALSDYVASFWRVFEHV
ncbi:MAG: hypothetical protein AAF385_07425 [Pseudomonadota bacterium]